MVQVFERRGNNELSQSSSSYPTVGRLIGALVVCLVLLWGCSDELYVRCDLEEGSECRTGQNVSCVETQNFQCKHRVCARYQGSEPFCTRPCESDADCSSGSCESFPFQAGTKYCVERTDIQ